MTNSAHCSTRIPSIAETPQHPFFHSLRSLLSQLSTHDKQNHNNDTLTTSEDKLELKFPRRQQFLQMHSEIYELLSELQYQNQVESGLEGPLFCLFTSFFEQNHQEMSLECFQMIMRIWDKLFNGRALASSFTTGTSNVQSLLLYLPEKAFLTVLLDSSRDSMEQFPLQIQNTLHWIMDSSCSKGENHQICDQMDVLLPSLHRTSCKVIGPCEEDNALPKQILPRWRFTRTKNQLKPSQLSLETNNGDASMSRQVTPTVTKLPDVGLWIDHLLTPEECEHLIMHSNEIGYNSLTHEFQPQERDSHRLLLLCPELAQDLWERMEPLLVEYMKDSDPSRAFRPCGFLSHGTWEPKYINPCLRFCKYPPGKKSVGFSIHRDGNYIQSERERSALSMVVYLNHQNFEGGKTCFYRSHTGPKSNETIQEELSRGYTEHIQLTPKAGSCLLFDPKWLHQGAPVLSGTDAKYIIRSDVVFQRDEPSSTKVLQSLAFNENYQLMHRLYKKAAEYETSGNVEKSSEYYEKALSVRVAESWSNKI